MILKELFLQQFRSHIKSHFKFDTTTIIIGKNTAGKTNILEAINLLSTGKSFRVEKEVDLITSGYDFGRVEGIIFDERGKIDLTAILAKKVLFSKKFLVNNVAKRQVDFASHFYSVIFTPQDIEIISSSPSLRRKFIDSVLYKSDRGYRLASTLYEKALRQRNRMLSDIRDGNKNYKRSNFDYWNSILFENGSLLTNTRERFVEYVNMQKKDIFDFQLEYDKSLISEERLEKYYGAERASGMTLVGPQRDDFLFYYSHKKDLIKEFGSRGEQRLALLQMKLFEIQYMKKALGFSPILLLDDIFSELDSSNIDKVLHLLPRQQTIITTTHKEFVPGEILMGEGLKIIEL